MVARHFRIDLDGAADRFERGEGSAGLLEEEGERE